MRRHSFPWVAVTAWAVAALALLPSKASADSSGRWTAKAIIEAPRIIETAITRSGKTAFYITRQDHLDTNRRDSALYEVDIARKSRRLVLRSAWISRLCQIPGSSDWSVLADIGRGVQLYRLKSDGAIIPVVISRNTVVIGADPDKAVAISSDEPDQVYGVLDYGWSPDGRSLWYSSARAVPVPSMGYRILETPTVPLDVYRANISQLHIVSKGRDSLIAAARGTLDPYPTLYYRTAAAKWDSAPGPDGSFGLSYMERHVDSNGAVVSQRVHLVPSTGVVSPIASAHDQHVEDGVMGPASDGGEIAIRGPWSAEDLVEIHADGTVTDLGGSDIDRGSRVKDWQFPVEHLTVLAVRHAMHNDREGLVRIDAEGRAEDIDPELSIEGCAFSEQAGIGVCVRDGLNVPPSLVLVDVREWKAKPLLQISPSLDAIDPLTVVPRRWGEPGSEASGFVVYPRNYDPTVRYPAIILVHGADAENRFADPAFQWSYPAQLWSERGYVVVYVNDIYSGQSLERISADAQWQGGAGALSRAALRQLLWLDEVKLYAQIIKSLFEEGMIDPDHVGIAGYSRGSQKVNVAVTQAHLFAVSSTGDGAYFAPSQYWYSGINRTDQILFGGSPYDESALDAWRSISPVFRARDVSAAVLFQVARVLNSRVDFYRALRDENVPAEFEFFDQETHLLHNPANRMTAMTQNLDWFDYWLRGIIDSDPAKASQYARWDAMRTHRASPAP